MAVKKELMLEDSDNNLHLGDRNISRVQTQYLVSCNSTKREDKFQSEEKDKSATYDQQ